MDTNHSVMDEEIEMLKAIYVNEITVKHNDNGGCCIQAILHPATAEDTEKQFVCLTLEILLPKGYPDVLPSIKISKPRGLGEDHLSQLRQQLHDLVEERRGETMLYDMVHLTQESLTESNMPHGICAICLDKFSEKEDFTRTECYHYFHNQCFDRYIKHELDVKAEEANSFHYNRHMDKKEEPVGCPVCRVAIMYDPKKLSACLPVKDEHIDYKPDGRLRQWQREMKRLLAKQRAKGGLIDLEYERTKHLLPSNSNS